MGIRDWRLEIGDEDYDPILQLIGRLQIAPDIDVDAVINEHDKYIGEGLEQGMQIV